MARGPLLLLPREALTLRREGARHVLRRPVIGVAAAARTPDGRWLLIRRADTGTWAMPGGTLGWGEALAASLARGLGGGGETRAASLARELVEEAGVELLGAAGLVGVFSRPDRDPRFHGVTVVVA